MPVGITNLNRIVSAVVLSVACAVVSFGQDDENELDLDAVDFGFAAIQVDVLEPQIQLLLGYARVHCALARRACELSPKQETGLQLVNSDWIKAEVKKATDSPARQKVRGIARFLGANVVRAPQVVGNQPQEVSRAVRKVVDQHISELLDEPQSEEFEKQKEIRDTFRREAMSAVIIAALDRQLFLSAQQRDDLLAPIAESLKDQDLYWQFYFQNANHIPNIPTRIWSAHLDDKQLRSLRGLNKMNYGTEQMQLQMVQQQPIVAIEK